MTKGRDQRHNLYYMPFFEFLEEWSFRKNRARVIPQKIKKSSHFPFSVDTEDRYSYTSPHKKGSPYQTNLEFHLLMQTFEK